MATLDKLPLHPLPGHAAAVAARPLLVDGLVVRAREIDATAAAGIPRVRYDGDFACLQGWTVADLHWEGVRLSDVIALAGALPAAKYARIHSADFVLPLPLADAESAVLCDVLDDEALTIERGAPWRLLLPGGECFTSVKWVERIELSEAPGDNTAKSIAIARLQE